MANFEQLRRKLLLPEALRPNAEYLAQLIALVESQALACIGCRACQVWFGRAPGSGRLKGGSRGRDDAEGGRQCVNNETLLVLSALSVSVNQLDGVSDTVTVLVIDGDVVDCET